MVPFLYRGFSRHTYRTFDLLPTSLLHNCLPRTPPDYFNRHTLVAICSLQLSQTFIALPRFYPTPTLDQVTKESIPVHRKLATPSYCSILPVVRLRDFTLHRLSRRLLTTHHIAALAIIQWIVSSFLLLRLMMLWCLQSPRTCHDRNPLLHVYSLLQFVASLLYLLAKNCSRIRQAPK